MSVKRLSVIALLAALSAVLHIVEGMLPPVVFVAPVKLGLANIVMLVALLSLRRRDAFYVTLVRCALCSLLSGSFTGLLYSLTGAMLAFFAMLAVLPLYKKKTLSPVGMSVIGSFTFNLGQLFVGFFILGKGMLAYFPIMSLLSVPTGIAVGIAASLIKKSRVLGAVAAD